MAKYTTDLLSLAGDVPERIRDRKQIAQSDVIISISTEADLQKCIARLDASDQRLAEVEAGYDWKMATVVRQEGVDGGQVRFGVAWYDRDFYNEKRDIYLGADHMHMFAGMGAENSVEVSHYELAA